MPPSTRASEPRLPGAKPSSRTSATGTQEHSPTCYTASLLHPLRSLSLLHPGEPILLARAASKFWQIRKGRGIDIIAYQVPCAGYETPARSMGALKRAAMDLGCPPGQELVRVRFLKAACYQLNLLKQLPTQSKTRPKVRVRVASTASEGLSSGR